MMFFKEQIEKIQNKLNKYKFFRKIYGISNVNLLMFFSFFISCIGSACSSAAEEFLSDFCKFYSIKDINQIGFIALEDIVFKSAMTLTAFIGPYIALKFGSSVLLMFLHGFGLTTSVFLLYWVINGASWGLNMYHRSFLYVIAQIINHLQTGCRDIGRILLITEQIKTEKESKIDKDAKIGLFLNVRKLISQAASIVGNLLVLFLSKLDIKIFNVKYYLIYGILSFIVTTLMALLYKEQLVAEPSDEGLYTKIKNGYKAIFSLPKYVLLFIFSLIPIKLIGGIRKNLILYQARDENTTNLDLSVYKSKAIVLSTIVSALQSALRMLGLSPFFSVILGHICSIFSIITLLMKEKSSWMILFGYTLWLCHAVFSINPIREITYHIGKINIKTMIDALALESLISYVCLSMGTMFLYCLLSFLSYGYTMVFFAVILIIGMFSIALSSKSINVRAKGGEKTETETEK